MDQPRQRKKRDTSRKREEILNGAIEAFREYGYETVNMDQIAKKAGASKRTLYNHFSSKEELLQEVISRYLNSHQKIRSGIVYNEDDDLRSQIALFVDADLFLVDSPERQILAKVLTSIFLWDIELAVQTRKAYNQEEDPLVSWLKTAAAGGRIKPVNPQKATELFHALTQGILTWPALFMPMMTEEFISEKKKTVVELFLREIT